MEYDTVFEIGLKSFPWSTLLHPLFFLVGGALLVRFGKQRKVFQLVGILVGLLSILFLLIALVTLVPPFLKARHDYRAGSTSVVEGTVEEFHPAPALGPAREHFSINGVIFSYNVLDPSPCFHNEPFQKGRVHSGSRVRIHYNGACIQRVDALR
jgi:hypothetical protein